MKLRGISSITFREISLALLHLFQEMFFEAIMIKVSLDNFHVNLIPARVT